MRTNLDIPPATALERAPQDRFTLERHSPAASASGWANYLSPADLSRLLRTPSARRAIVALPLRDHAEARQ
jgi:hypothetical protein